MSDLPFHLNLAEPLRILEKEKSLTLVNVGNSAAKSYIISELFQKTNFQNIFWASTDESAENIHLSAECFFDGNIVLLETEIKLEQYYEVLQDLNTDEKNLFVFEDYEAALQQSLPTVEEIEAEKIIFKKGEKIKIFEVFESLGKKGYTVANDRIVQKGEFVRRGENFFIYPSNAKSCYRIELFGDEVENIEMYEQMQDTKAEKTKKSLDTIEVYPASFEDPVGGKLAELISEASNSMLIHDDLEEELQVSGDFHVVRFTTFPKNEEKFFHLNFFSVLPFYTIADFVTEVKERLRREFKVCIVTKRAEELENIFKENELMYSESVEDVEKYPSTLLLINKSDKGFVPHSFQNNEQEIFYLTDREIFQFKRNARQQKAMSVMTLDMINSLKPKDYVIHNDHGLALYDGIVRRKITEEMGEREYLKLRYAGSDKLFVPVESAEKVTKYIGDENPKLTKLGSADWQRTQSKLKKEAEKIAKELLKLYAARELATAKPFEPDDEMMKSFCEAFPYELTPGQKQSWEDVRVDMERPRPMDRLVCGDVGFGKTEIAMRAAFKCFRTGRQCAILAPITILAEQHYEGLVERINGCDFGVRVELLSRFQTQAQQNKILKDLEHGLVDIVIGTHRLLSDDIKFKNLGILIIDEEQRFGVKQKEKLKELRAGVDLLTLTATPIPRTLHMSLNKLKDISTITTPPPGRLPVVTEVRKYNLNLIREQIIKEVERGGQVYFLHNEVKSIDAITQQLGSLIPEAKFVVAHGQLSSQDLENRIRTFKEGKADVLVASTIIENGIDLPNANTLFVNRADRFGLSQLYQLRGRVGRSRTQAYAYFLYHGQKLELDARKRLRAIVEASELGSGFQIAMKDLEIRGAGEILGANQSGTMKDTGVSHFMRMLHKTMDEIKSGAVSTEVEEEENVTVEIPLSAYIPPSYIPNADEKIQVYQELAGCENPEALKEVQQELASDYGELPVEVENLCKVIRLKMALRATNLSGLRIHRASHKSHEVILRMGKNFDPQQVFGLLKDSEHNWIITATTIKLVTESLPITWYKDILNEVSYLEKPKSKPKKKKEKTKKTS